MRLLGIRMLAFPRAWRLLDGKAFDNGLHLFSTHRVCPLPGIVAPNGPGSSQLVYVSAQARSS